MHDFIFFSSFLRLINHFEKRETSPSQLYNLNKKWEQEDAYIYISGREEEEVLKKETHGWKWIQTKKQ